MKVNLDINNRDKIEVGDIVLCDNKKCLVIFNNYDDAYKIGLLDLDSCEVVNIRFDLTICSDIKLLCKANEIEIKRVEN